MAVCVWWLGGCENDEEEEGRTQEGTPKKKKQHGLRPRRGGATNEGFITNASMTALNSHSLPITIFPPSPI